jgi:lipoic acid synthetase
MQELPVISGGASAGEARMKKPNWLRVKLPIGEEYRHVRSLVVLIWASVGEPVQLLL